MEEKSIFASKTFWFAILFGVVHLAGLVGFGDYTPSQDVSEIVNVLAAAAMIVLRAVTNKGVRL